MSPKSSEDNSKPTSDYDDTTPASPSQPRRFQPIVMPETDDSGAEGSGTVRRKLSATSGGTYGTMASSTPVRSSDETGEGQKTSSAENPTSERQNDSDSSSLHRQTLSPERTESTPKTRKPNMPRRGSSQLQRHRGQDFSVDDDPSEVERDLAQRQASGRSSIRKMPSGLRRRGTAQPTPLPRVESNDEGEVAAEAGIEHEQDNSSDADGADKADTTPQADSGEEVDGPSTPEDEEYLSDAESFTLKDKQDAINKTHPFGVRIWKPALYKKSRSVQKTAEGDIHSSPGGRVSRWLFMFNILWTIMFGWWLAITAALGAIVCVFFGFTQSSVEYGHVLFGLAGYLLYPFGKFVKLEQDEAYAEEDRGEGRSISEYEQWQSGDLEDGRLFFGPISTRSVIGARRNSLDSSSETDSLLGRSRRDGVSESGGTRSKRRLFGRGNWNIGRIIFFVFFYFLITPSLFLVSGICWLMVFWIPMAKVTLLLFRHLRRHPLALSFHSDSAYSRGPGSPSSSILMCTYRAVGLKYWKYTVDGTNIFLINLIGVVLFVIFDYWVLDVALGMKFFLTHPAFIFLLSLFSIIPLAYFIGQAVASISAQSSMGLGAAINAFFSTVVEVFLYCVALREGKGQLVEGSVIGSIFAGILFLPGLSMCFGAIKRKTQRFNAKSAGVTSTMLLFAVIAAFGPTLFYQIYGTHELNCRSCIDSQDSGKDCRRCYFSQVPAVNDRFFIQAVRPYCWFAAVLLFLSYIIGLWFTLRTHAASIWAAEADEKKPLSQNQHQPASGNLHEHRGSNGGQSFSLTRQNTNITNAIHANSIRDTALYKRILGQSLKHVGLSPRSGEDSRPLSIKSPKLPPHMVPPQGSGEDSGLEGTSPRALQIPGFSDEENQNLVREVAEMAATAATVAARDAARAPRKTSLSAQIPHHSKPASVFRGHTNDPAEAGNDGTVQGGGHDAPNWSRTKSSVVLLGATLLYAVIAEILVNTVDVVLENFDIDEKFLGITLFALVPNTTEFLNAISFAMNGNIALSMEIGSAYALQVCLLQVPALVLFSAVHGRFIDPSDLVDHTFTLIFPQWDMVTVILCVFLLSYMYGEGKSNYFKGSILILSYLVVLVGFYFSGLTDVDMMQIDRFDTLGLNGEVVTETFKTIGRGKTGRAY